MNNNGNKFMDGFVLGAIIGGAAVFLLGTRTGKNLLKIVSEQGLDGLTNLLEEYDLSEVEEDEEVGTSGESNSDSYPKSQEVSEPEAEKESTPKKRFFKRIRK